MMPQAYITTSVFDLFKVGPGPSSSHTIGPMKATFDFLQRIQQLPLEQQQAAQRITVQLFGSLSATGKGHGTDRAVLAGLLGYEPHRCDPKELNSYFSSPSDVYAIQLPHQQVPMVYEDIIFERKRKLDTHPNTLIVSLLGGEGQVIHQEEYYSVGGGFVQRKGETPSEQHTIQPPYPYTNMEQLKAHLTANNITLTELMLTNEEALTGKSRKEIFAGLDEIVDTMHKAVKRGLKDKSVLPGRIQLRRKAAILFEQAKAQASTTNSFMIFMNAYCIAASEENAAGNVVVTAPTSGASGVIPGVTYFLKHHYHYSKEKLREGMLAAAAVGFLIKQNASISGAEMGCMGEIGSASAMAAAMLAYCADSSINTVEAAAEIAIEHHLGMTCDPIGGYVQIPCIERNAMGGIKAYNAYLLAAAGNTAYQKISLDSVIKVMRATGNDMSKKYKETSEGGLALSMTEC